MCCQVLEELKATQTKNKEDIQWQISKRIEDNESYFDK